MKEEEAAAKGASAASAVQCVLVYIKVELEFEKKMAKKTRKSKKMGFRKKTGEKARKGKK